MNEELLQEYRFDYSKARSNRFSQRTPDAQDEVVVQLDHDVAQVFTSAEHVNAILRAIIQNMPNKSIISTKIG